MSVLKLRLCPFCHQLAEASGRFENHYDGGKLCPTSGVEVRRAGDLPHLVRLWNGRRAS